MTRGERRASMKHANTIIITFTIMNGAKIAHKHSIARTSGNHVKIDLFNWLLFYLPVKENELRTTATKSLIKVSDRLIRNFISES